VFQKPILDGKNHLSGERAIFVHKNKMRGAEYKLGGAGFKCLISPISSTAK